MSVWVRTSVVVPNVVSASSGAGFACVLYARITLCFAQPVVEGFVLYETLIKLIARPVPPPGSAGAVRLYSR